jgi:hypothetical protein
MSPYAPAAYTPRKYIWYSFLLKDFFALKNPTASVGFEPANLGTKGQRANPLTTEAADRRLYFPSEGRRAEDVFALKNFKAL